MANQITAVTYPAASNAQWDADYEVNLSWAWGTGYPSTGYAGLFDGYLSGQLWAYDNYASYDNGSNLHAQFKWKMTYEDVVSYVPPIARLINGTNAAGVHLLVDLVASTSKYRLRCCNTSSAGGGYTGYILSLNTWYLIDLYIEVNSDAGEGKLAVLVDGTERIRDDDLQTKVNGVINRFAVGGTWASATKEGIWLFDNVYVWDEDRYSEWPAPAGGIPLMQGANMGLGTHLCSAPYLIG